MYCHKCDELLSEDTFYSDNNYASNKFPICKRCVLQMVEQRKDNRTPPNETPESV